MANSDEFIEKRARDTRDVQEQIADVWVWPEHPLADWDAKLGVLDGRKITEAAEEADMEQKRATIDASVKDLERRKQIGIAIARVRFRDEATKISQLDALEDLGSGRRATIDETTHWLATWGEIDAAFVPAPGNTVAALLALHDVAEAQLKDYTSAGARWRKSSLAVGETLGELDEWNVAWYEEATRLFPADSPQGDLIRGRISTTYSPDEEVPPLTPVPTP